jgi:hypothetical protein
MRVRNTLITLAVLSLATLAGCKKNIQNKDAVKQAVLEHLSKRSDLQVGQMEVEVTNVTFRENEADAVISFKPKGVEGGGMEMRYALERKGSVWAVKAKADSGGAGHGAVTPEPAGGAGAMPPGHGPAAAPPGGKAPAAPGVKK